MTCWGRSLRSRVRPALWDRIRLDTLGEDPICAVCGRDDCEFFECHEVWDYVDAELFQRLAAVIALCPDCHQAKHMGLANVLGLQQAAERHMRSVNGWSRIEAARYIDVCLAIWCHRSQNTWNQDLSWITEQGYPYIARPREPRLRLRSGRM